MQIIPTSAVEIIQDVGFNALRDEYIAECANAGLPRPQEKLEMYAALDASGTLFAYKAVQDGLLCGFAVLLAPVLPHYGRCVAVTESVFVGKAYRSTGAGLRLLRALEVKAKEVGSPALIVSAPVGGALDALLPRLAYDHTNNAYTKRFSCNS